MAEKKAFIIYNDYIGHFEMLSVEERGELIMLMLLYVNGRDIDISVYSGAVRMAFSFIKADIDRNSDKYEQTCRNRSKAAQKREEKKRSTAYHKDHNCADTDEDAKTETETDADTESERGNETFAFAESTLPAKAAQSARAPHLTLQPRRNPFVPPTIEDVRAYCDEGGYPIDAERFVDYYGSQEWRKSNGQRITDWQAAVRQWRRMDEQNSKNCKAEVKSPGTASSYSSFYSPEEVEMAKAMYGGI